MSAVVQQVSVLLLQILNFMQECMTRSSKRVLFANAGSSQYEISVQTEGRMM